MLEQVEAFLIRRAMVEGEARDYDAVAYAVLRHLSGAGDPAKALRQRLSGFGGSGSAWPTDDEIITFARDGSMAKYKGGGVRVKLFLAVIEQGLRTDKQEPLIEDLDGLTLEHLMPKSWATNWPPTPGVAAEERDRLVYTLGNMTLLTGPANWENGNESWGTKLPVLRNSLLLLNASMPDVWDEAAIRARSERLARVLVRAVPGPDPSAPVFAPDVDSETFNEASMAESEDRPSTRNSTRPRQTTTSSRRSSLRRWCP